MGKIITNGFKLTLGEDLKLLRFEKHQLVKTRGIPSTISKGWVHEHCYQFSMVPKNSQTAGSPHFLLKSIVFLSQLPRLRARWRVMSFFKTLKLGRLIANQIREFCPKTVTLLIRRLPPKFFMCGLGKLCPSVYIVKTGQFSDLFRKPVKNICVSYPSHFFGRIW